MRTWEHARVQRGKKRKKAARYSEPLLEMINQLQWAELTSRGPVCKFSSCPNNPTDTHTHIVHPVCPLPTHMETGKSATYSNLLHPQLCPSSKVKISPVNVHLSCFKIKAGLLSKHFFVSGGWKFEVSNITMYRRSVMSRSSTTTEMPSVLHKSTDMLTVGCFKHYDISLIINDVFVCDQYFMLQLVETEQNCSLSAL